MANRSARRTTCATIVLGHQPGDEITLTIVKGTANGPADQREVKVTLAARPAQQQFQMPPGFQPGVPAPTHARADHSLSPNHKSPDPQARSGVLIEGW